MILQTVMYASGIEMTLLKECLMGNLEVSILGFAGPF